MNQLRIVIFTTFLFFINIAAASNFGTPDSNGGVYEIPNLNFESTKEELSSLSELVQNYDIVGLGEPIHGSHEMSVARVKFIRHLVKNDNFRFIVFESPWYSSLYTNAYINSCQGDPKVAQSHLHFAAWMDNSITELLQWLCKFNQQHPNDKVVLLGNDMQQAETDKIILTNYFSLVDPSLARNLNPKINDCLDMKDMTNTDTKEKYNNCLETLSVAKLLLDKNYKQYLIKSNDEFIFQANLAISTLRAFQKEAYYYKSQPKISYEARDEEMFHVFNKIRDRYAKGKKSIIYAHNYHISKNSVNDSVYMHKSMGSFLSENNPKYFVIGGIGYEVKVNKTVFPNFPDLSIPTSDNSVEKALHDSNSKFSLIKTDGSFLGTDTPREMQDQTFPFTTVPSKHYDALFYLDYSGPLQL